MIPNKRPASEYRVRTLDRNDLNEKGKIYIGKGGTTTVDGVAGVSDITAKNIIDAINDNATNKNITAGSFTATGAIQSATLSCQGNITSENGEMIAASFKGNADSATRATYASADTSKGTIEERLTNLGFKQLPTDRSAGLYVSGAGLNGNIRLLREGTTREGNRALALFNVTFSSSTAQVGAMFDFFGNNREAISSAGFIPVEYRPKSTVTTIFPYRLTYNYANGLHFQTVACMSCTIHGADTEDAGKVTLQVLTPGLTGVATTLSAISIVDASAYARAGYQCKPIS